MKCTGVVFVLAGIASCSDQFPSTLTAAQVENSSLDCPLAQPVAVDASVTDVDNGVAISFSGPVTAVDLIRANVHTMKYANGSQGNPFSVCPCANDAPQYGLPGPLVGSTGSAGQVASESGGPRDGTGGDGRTAPPAGAVSADASMDETPLGARLVLKPKDPTQLQALRDAVRAHVGAMQTSCTRPF